MDKQRANRFVAVVIAAIFSLALLVCSCSSKIILQDLNGTPVTLEQYKGRNMLLYVFSLACTSCASDLSLLDEVNRVIEPANNYMIVIVNQTDTNIALTKWIGDKKYNVKVLTDANKTLQANLKFYPREVPWSILVDPSGVVVKKKEGPFNDVNQFRNFIGYKGSTALDNNPPKISDITVDLNSSKMELLVTWKTDKDANDRIVLTDEAKGLCYAYGNHDKFVRNHEIIINVNEISPITVCDITIISADFLDNQTVIEQAKNYKLNATASISIPGKDFTLPSIKGQTIRLSDYRGKKIFLHFWNYRCGTCQEELPLIKSFYTASPNNGPEVLTVNVGGKIEALTSYVSDNGYTFPVLHDGEGASDELFNLAGVPVSCLLDENGSVIKKHDGPFESIYEIREFAGTEISTLSF